MLNLETELHWN